MPKLIYSHSAKRRAQTARPLAGMICVSQDRWPETAHAEGHHGRKFNPEPGSTGTEVEITVTVRFGDTDPYGVIYFASYFRYCHHGIEEFFRHHGLPPHESSEPGRGLRSPHRFGAVRLSETRAIR